MGREGERVRGNQTDLEVETRIFTTKIQEKFEKLWKNLTIEILNSEISDIWENLPKKLRKISEISKISDFFEKFYPFFHP